jgi:hypothetical protein
MRFGDCQAELGGRGISQDSAAGILFVALDILEGTSALVMIAPVPLQSRW